MGKYLIVLVFILINHERAVSQNNKILDSLLLQNNQLEDTLLVDNLINISRQYFIAGDTLSLKYSLQAFTLSKQIGFKEGEGKSALFYALAIQEYSIDSALHYFIYSAQTLQKLNHSWAGYGFENAVRIFRTRAMWPQSLEFTIKSLKAFQETNDTTMIAKSLSNIGYTYTKLDNYEKSKEYLLRAKKLLPNIKNKEIVGLIYGRMAITYDETNYYDSAYHYYKNALISFKELGDSYYISQYLSNLANTCIHLNKINEAEKYLIQARQYRTTTEDNTSLYSNLGKVHIEQNQLNSAKLYLDSALTHAHIYKNNMFINEVYYRKHELEAKRGNYKQALQFYTTFKHIEDSLKTSDKNRKIAELEVTFETQKKEQENKRLAKENELAELRLSTAKRNRRNLIIIFNISALLAFVVFYSWLSKMRIKNKAALNDQMAEQKNLRFKAVIEAEEKERMRIAKDLHDGIGQLLSAARVNVASLEGEVDDEDEIIVENSLKVIDDSIKEIRTISHNMMPVALVDFGLIKAIETLALRINQANAIQVKINHTDIDGKLDKNTEISLYRIIQEVVNNMLKHSEAKIISIDLQRKESKVYLNIRDNGKGFDVKEIENSSGLGWKNIYSRLLMIGGNINIESNPGIGTIINIDFSI